MDTIRICKQCQKPVPEAAPEGLCPDCLAKVALGSEPAASGERIPPTPADLARQFPQLEIIELLGMGGMGMVYKARQARLDRLVALKILPVDSAHGASFAERFEREARALAKLNHPGIVTLHDFGQTSDYYYFIMEYVDGMNLRQLLQAETLAPRQALELVGQICTALQFAHDEKIVHRDIKPENILITKKGQVKIADFGLAKLLGGQPDTALTASQMVMGTFNYMAPEQREKPLEVDHRADIYSLGVVFYEMLTGEVPMGRFDAPSKKVQIDVRLDEVVLHALEREPARRYQQVSEVKSSVDTITSSTPQEKKPSGAPEKFKLKAPPGFFSYVLPRFAIFAVALLGAGLCLRWAVGDTELAVGTNGPSSLPMQILNGLLLVCLGFSYWGYAWWTLPVGFLVVLNMWLEKMAALGLTPRQIQQPIRRRLAQRLGWMTGGFIAVFLATLFLWFHFTTNTSVSVREVQNRTDESTEWWFVPSSGAYEKLGLHATFSSSGETKNGVESLPACTVSLIVHRKDRETPVLNVTLPGLHASYRFPATNSWDNTFILDKGSLVEWLHNGAGLDPAAPTFHEEAGQIYELLKAYEIQPPQTVKEFVNLAKADLQAFWFGGMQGGNFSYGGLGRSSFVLLLALLVIEGFIYQYFMLGVIRRAYTAALLEIVDGRWTPPKAAPPFPTAIKVLCGILALSLVCSVASSVAKFSGKGNLDAAIVMVNLSSMLLVNFSLAVILIVALRLHSRQRIQQAREKGLWPPLGEMPTLEQVKGLAQAGDMFMATKLYRQIHLVSWLDARAAVEKLAGDSPPSETFKPQPRPNFASYVWKPSTMLVLACLVGAFTGLAPDWSYTTRYWGVVVTEDANAPVQVLKVASDSPAERTGFMVDDVIKEPASYASFSQSWDKVKQGDKQTFTVRRGGKDVMLAASAGADQLAAVWYANLWYPIAGALFICIGIIVFATASVARPPLWRSISVAIAGLGIAIGFAVAVAADSVFPRLAVYERWIFVPTRNEWCGLQGLIGMAAAVLVTILGAAEIRKRLRKPPPQSGSAG